MMNVTPGLLFFGGYHPQTSEINSFRNSLLLFTELGSENSGFTWSGVRYVAVFWTAQDPARCSKAHHWYNPWRWNSLSEGLGWLMTFDDFCTWSPQNGDGTWDGNCWNSCGWNRLNINASTSKLLLENGWQGMHRSIPSIIMDNDLCWANLTLQDMSDLEMCGQGRQMVKKQFQAWTMNPRAHGTAIRTISDSHNATNWPMSRHMVHWPWYMHVYSTQQFQLREVRSLSFMQTYQYLVKLHTWLVINSWLCNCIYHSNFPEGYPCYIPIFNPISHHKHIYIYTRPYIHIYSPYQDYIFVCAKCVHVYLVFPYPPKTKTFKTLHFIAFIKDVHGFSGLPCLVPTARPCHPQCPKPRPSGWNLRQWHEVASPRRRPGGQVRAGRANAQQDAGAAVTTDLGMGMGPPGCFPTNFWVGV